MNQFKETYNKLKNLKPLLVEKYSVKTLGLFGSVVRNENTASIDIDILVDFSKPIGIEFVDLADYLESELKNKVDLISTKAIKKKYFNTIKSEIKYV